MTAARPTTAQLLARIEQLEQRLQQLEATGSEIPESDDDGPFDPLGEAKPQRDAEDTSPRISVSLLQVEQIAHWLVAAAAMTEDQRALLTATYEDEWLEDLLFELQSWAECLADSAMWVRLSRGYAEVSE